MRSSFRFMFGVVLVAFFTNTRGFCGHPSVVKFEIFNNSNHPLILIPVTLGTENNTIIRVATDFSEKSLPPRTSMHFTDKFENLPELLELPKSVQFPIVLRKVEVLTSDSRKKIGEFCLLFDDPNPRWFFSIVGSPRNLTIRVACPRRGGCPPWPFEIYQKDD